MATYASDEEQIEALKRWWKENGNSLFLLVAIVLAAFFGTRMWQTAREDSAAAASDLYQQIAELVVTAGPGQGIGEDQFFQATDLYDRLHTDFTDSIYTRYGALMMASVYVSRDNYGQAARELQWILDNPDLGFMREAAPELLLTARVRLARVLLAQDQPQEALDLLTAVEPGELAAIYNEVQGDAYLKLGQHAAARAAYQRAIDGGSPNANLIDLKLQGISGDSSGQTGEVAEGA